MRIKFDHQSIPDALSPSRHPILPSEPLYAWFLLSIARWASITSGSPNRICNWIFNEKPGYCLCASLYLNAASLTAYAFAMGMGETETSASVSDGTGFGSKERARSSSAPVPTYAFATRMVSIRTSIHLWKGWSPRLLMIVVESGCVIGEGIVPAYGWWMAGKLNVLPCSSY